MSSTGVINIYRSGVLGNGTKSTSTASNVGP